MNDELGDITDWDGLRTKIGVYMETLFVLNNDQDKEVWQYILGIAAHLEYLAVAILWVASGRPCSFEEYEDKLTLGQAIKKIEEQSLLSMTIVDIVGRINKLRNSVAHRGAVSGVTVQGNTNRGLYNGKHVFTDLEALKQVAVDHKTAVEAMVAWLQAQQ